MTTLDNNNTSKAVEDIAKGATSGGAEASRWAEIAVDSQQAKTSNATSDTQPSDGSKSGAVGKSLGSAASDAVTSNGHSNGGKLSEAAQSLGSKVGQALSDNARVGDAVSAGKAIGETAAKIVGDGISNIVRDDYGRASDGISSIKDSYFKHNFPEKVTDEQRKQAKEKLEKELSELIPEKDRQSLKNLQSAIIDGDLGKLQSSLKELSGNPEQLRKIVSALNKQMEKRMGVDMRMDAAGNVLLYESGGSTALSINPKTGESTLRPMETQMDGSVVLKPGEIINRTPADVLKNIGDEATRSLTHDRFYGILKAQPMDGSMKKWLEPKSYSKDQELYPIIPQELNQLRNK